MNIFHHELWPTLKPYAKLTVGRDNLDLLQLPDDLRTQALAITLPCVACTEPCHVFRARVKSQRSRIAQKVEEQRLFYAATCPSSVNPGCARTRAAKNAKKTMRECLGEQREDTSVTSVQILDKEGAVIAHYATQGTLRQVDRVRIPAEAVFIEFVCGRSLH